MQSERTPSPRATREQKEERIKFCVSLMEQHASKDGRIFTPRMIARLLAKKYGLSTKSTWRYVSAASERYQQVARVPKVAKAGWVSDFLEEVVANPSVDMKHRLNAALQYSTLWGIMAPTKTANTTVDGQDIAPVTTPAQDRAELLKTLEQVKPPEVA